MNYLTSYFLKEMFTAKVDGGLGGGGIGTGGTGGKMGASDKEKTRSNSSARSGRVKSKWVKAFKRIQMNKEDDASDPRYEKFIPLGSSIFLYLTYQLL